MYTNFKSPHARSPVTVPHLHELKAKGEKIVALTAYDASFAAQCDESGIDVVLVGDSLGMFWPSAAIWDSAARSASPVKQRCAPARDSSAWRHEPSTSGH